MNRIQHLLIRAAEECNETAQRITKALVFTPEEIQTGQPFSNSERIIYEFNDLYALMEMLKEEGVIDHITDREMIDLKKKKVEEGLEYCKKLNTLD